MNVKNIEATIAIMKRAGEVNMDSWQTPVDLTTFVSTEAEMHQCGNSACFAGWVAVSPEFHAFGGSASNYGSPMLEGETSVEGVISKWLGVPCKIAQGFVYGDSNSLDYGDFSPFYNKNWNEVNAQDVIAKLEELLAQAQQGEGGE